MHGEIESSAQFWAHFDFIQLRVRLNIQVTLTVGKTITNKQNWVDLLI